MSFFKKHPTVIALIVVVIALIFFANAFRGGTPVEDAVGSTVSPVMGGFAGFTRNVGNWFRTVFGISDIQRENAVLKEQVERLQSEAATTREFQKENERLKRIANYVEENDDYDTITAPVISKNQGYWFDTFLIGAGRNAELTEGMPVVTPDGLVGRISEVNANWSKVESIIDPICQLSGIVERTRDYVVVQGDTQIGADESVCNVNYVPIDNDLLPNDQIKTSGLNGIYPKGLLIGTILSTSRVGEVGGERSAQLKPAVDFSMLEEVMVIRKVWEEIQPES